MSAKFCEKSTIAMMHFKKTIHNYPFLDNHNQDNRKSCNFVARQIV